FYSPAHHRHLHSFPTRRSSDLTRSNPTCNPNLVRAQNSINAFTPQLSFDYHPVAAFPFATAAIPDFSWSDAPTQPASPAGTLSKDRKSTRLNSSHVAISYAVFC